MSGSSRSGHENENVTFTSAVTSKQELSKVFAATIFPAGSSSGLLFGTFCSEASPESFLPSKNSKSLLSMLSSLANTSNNKSSSSTVPLKISKCLSSTNLIFGQRTHRKPVITTEMFPPVGQMSSGNIFDPIFDEDNNAELPMLEMVTWIEVENPVKENVNMIDSKKRGSKKVASEEIGSDGKISKISSDEIVSGKTATLSEKSPLNGIVSAKTSLTPSSSPATAPLNSSAMLASSTDNGKFFVFF